MSAQPRLLDDASLALIRSSHAAKAIAVADGQPRATLTYAYSCQVDVASARVVAVIGRSQSDPVLAAIRAGGKVALVVSDIETFQSLQVKGDGARIIDLDAGERERLVAHCQAFAAFAETIGYDPAVIAAHMGCRADDAIGIEFTLRQAFIQTPGPSAGQPLAKPS